jgi:hypothetical protein
MPELSAASLVVAFLVSAFAAFIMSHGCSVHHALHAQQ